MRVFFHVLLFCFAAVKMSVTSFRRWIDNIFFNAHIVSKLKLYCILLCLVSPVTGTGHRCLSANVVTVKKKKKKRIKKEEEEANKNKSWAQTNIMALKLSLSFL